MTVLREPPKPAKFPCLIVLIAELVIAAVVTGLVIW
jgi:hypothetical protein